MKIIDLNCPGCGANMKANAELKKAICNYCGHEILIDNEKIELEISNGRQFGYEQELGRQKARDERYQRYQEHLQFVKMELSLQYLIDMKSQSFFAENSGYAICAVLVLPIIILFIIGKIGLGILFGFAFGGCIYATFTTVTKVEKMKNDLANNNFNEYMDDIERVMEINSIKTKAEEIARKDFGEI